MRIYEMNGNYANYTRNHYSNNKVVYVYDITCDGKVTRYERPKMLDYKATISNFKKAYGYKSVKIAFVERYCFN